MQGVAELDEIFVSHLLHLVRRVTSLEMRTEGPALNRLSQDDSWLAILLSGSLVSRE